MRETNTNSKQEIGVVALISGILALYSYLADSDYFNFIDEITWATYYLSQIIFLVILVFVAGYAVGLAFKSGNIRGLFSDLGESVKHAKKFAAERDAKRKVKENEKENENGREKSVYFTETQNLDYLGAELPIKTQILNPIAAGLPTVKKNRAWIIIIALILVIALIFISSEFLFPYLEAILK